MTPVMDGGCIDMRAVPTCVRVSSLDLQVEQDSFPLYRHLWWNGVDCEGGLDPGKVELVAVALTLRETTTTRRNMLIQLTNGVRGLDWIGIDTGTDSSNVDAAGATAPSRE